MIAKGSAHDSTGTVAYQSVFGPSQPRSKSLAGWQRAAARACRNPRRLGMLLFKTVVAITFKMWVIGMQWGLAPTSVIW